MKMSELYTFMNEHGGAKAFMNYYEVADECEDIQFGAEDSEVSAEDMKHYIQEGEPSPVTPVTDVTRTVMYPVKSKDGVQYGIVQGEKRGNTHYCCPVRRANGKTVMLNCQFAHTQLRALELLDDYLREAGIECGALADYILVAKNDRKNNIYGLTPKPMTWLNRIGSIPVPVQLYEELW